MASAVSRAVRAVVSRHARGRCGDRDTLRRPARGRRSGVVGRVGVRASRCAGARVAARSVPTPHVSRARTDVRHRRARARLCRASTRVRHGRVPLAAPAGVRVDVPRARRGRRPGCAQRRGPRQPVPRPGHASVSALLQEPAALRSTASGLARSTRSLSTPQRAPGSREHAGRARVAFAGEQASVRAIGRHSRGGAAEATRAPLVSAVRCSTGVAHEGRARWARGPRRARLRRRAAPVRGHRSHSGGAHRGLWDRPRRLGRPVPSALLVELGRQPFFVRGLGRVARVLAPRHRDSRSVRRGVGLFARRGRSRLAGRQRSRPPVCDLHLGLCLTR